MLGSVNTAVGSTSPEASFGSHCCFCSSVPLPQDQLGGDLGAGAERADADIAARQFLGDDAHRFLAEPHAAEFLRDGEAEHAEVGHLRDDVERDVAVGAVPAVRVRSITSLSANLRISSRIDSSVSSRPQAPTVAVVGAAHQLDEPRAAHRRVAGRDQHLDLGRARAPRPRRRQAEIGRAHDLALAHRNAAEDLREVFAEPDADQQFLDLAEPAGRLHALGIGGELAHRLDIGREPRQPVGGALLAVEQCGSTMRPSTVTRSRTLAVASAQDAPPPRRSRRAPWSRGHARRRAVSAAACGIVALQRLIALLCGAQTQPAMAHRALSTASRRTDTRPDRTRNV